MSPSHLPRFGSFEDPDGCIVITGQFRDADTADRPHPQTYHPIELPFTTFTPLGKNLCLPVPYLFGIARPRNEVYATVRRGAKHLFSHFTYDFPVYSQRPRGVMPTPLLMSGRRQWWREPGTGAPDEGCWQDAFITWMPRRGEPNFPAAAIHTTNYGVSLIAMRKAIGALVSTYPVYNNGAIISYETAAVLIEVDFHLGPPDYLRLDVYGHTYRHSEPSVEPVMLSERMNADSPSWDGTYTAAIDGFHKECEVIPNPFVAPEIDTTERDKFVAEILELNDWRKALDQVDEAWQLNAACRAYADHADFSHRPTLYKRAKEMLNKYLGERPAESQRLDDLWPQITEDLQTNPA